MSEELKPCPVTRWDAINDGMADDPIEFMECEDGDWVQYEDAARLERERDEAQKMLERFEREFDESQRDLVAAKAEVERLNKLVCLQASMLKDALAARETMTAEIARLQAEAKGAD